MAVQFNSENFESLVLNQPGTVLVDFWATWCPPCRALGPIIEQVAADNKDKAVVGKLNVDESPEIAGNYGIASIPTVLVFRDGQVVDSIVGLNSKQTYQDVIDQLTLPV